MKIFVQEIKKQMREKKNDENEEMKMAWSAHIYFYLVFFLFLIKKIISPNKYFFKKFKLILLLLFISIIIKLYIHKNQLFL